MYQFAASAGDMDHCRGRSEFGPTDRAAARCFAVGTSEFFSTVMVEAHRLLANPIDSRSGTDEKPRHVSEEELNESRRPRDADA